MRDARCVASVGGRRHLPVARSDRVNFVSLLPVAFVRRVRPSARRVASRGSSSDRSAGLERSECDPVSIDSSNHDSSFRDPSVPPSLAWMDIARARNLFPGRPTDPRARIDGSFVATIRWINTWRRRFFNPRSWNGSSTDGCASARSRDSTGRWGLDGVDGTDREGRVARVYGALWILVAIFHR